MLKIMFMPISLVFYFSLYFGNLAYAESVVIGSKKFTESIILGDILKNYINLNNPEIKVEHKKQMGSTRILWSALLNGQIDVYTEYTGTLSQDLVPSEYKTKEQINDYLNSVNVGIGYHIGFNNSYALGVTKDFSEKFNIKTISDLKKLKDPKYAFTEEFLNRDDGWPGLKRHYGIQAGRLRSIDHDISYRALINGDVQVIDLYTSDPEIQQYGLVILQDDSNYFLKYEAIYLYNKKNKSIEAILKELNFRITEADMIKMNYDVKFLHKSEETTAKSFLATDERSEIKDSYIQEMIKYSYEHLWIVGIALLLGVPLGLLLGTTSHYVRKLKIPIVYGVSFFQTIPSIAFLVLLIGPLSYFGFDSIGNTPAILTLFLYSLMPITTTTLNALDSIPKNYTDISDILNIKLFDRLFYIKFPLAMQEILNSIRNTVVATIGSATLGALVGAGGLGQPILSGIRLDNYSLILMGIIPAIFFIIMTHLIFKLVDIFVISKGLKL